MYRLNGSVGQGGRNAHDDVQLVQVQLNKNAHLVAEIGRVPEDGNLDEATQRAIVAFQRQLGGHSAPDGRVDPRGQTWRRLLGDIPHATVEALSALSTDGQNLYLYENQDRCWGTTLTLQSIRTLVAALRPAGIVLGIGDISYAQGGRMPPHASHRRGIDVDLRPQREDQSRSPVRVSDPAYSHDRTRLVVEALVADDNLELIFFNDTRMPGVRFHEGHDNHLHCRFMA
jgi:hypothetical protein